MRKTVIFVAGLLVCLSPPVLGAGGAPGADGTFELIPGVVVNPTSATVFMMNPAGGIDSVAIPSGALQWTSDRAAKPLAFYDDVLVAQVEKPAAVGGLEIALLDARHDGDTRQTLRIELPKGIHSAVDEGLGKIFLTRSVVRGREPYVHWEYIERYSQGATPQPGQNLETRQGAVYRLDVARNRVIEADAAVFAVATPVAPVQVQEWASLGRAATRILPAGGVWATTELRSNGSKRDIVLKRWDAGSGAALPDVTLFSDPHVAQLRSVDHQHLLVAEHAAPGDFAEYEWHLFSLETGQKLGQVSHHQSASLFFVTDNLVTYVQNPYGRLVNDKWLEEPRKLRTILLGSASPVWERTVRDTQYVGPFPP